MKNPASRNKPLITITLKDDQQEAFVPSYMTLDKIQGEVNINAPYDTAFDHIYITLEGTAKTFVEKIATVSPTNGRTEAYQVFLRLIQPLDANVFSEPRVLRAGRHYRFPFTFVVPEKLLPQSCVHAHANERTEDAHLSLPPSLGDPMTASLGKTLLDDLAPEMAVISYAVKTRIIHGYGSTGKPIVAAENTKRLRIVPAVGEQPRVPVFGGLKDDYRLRKEKDVKKGFFKGKLGCVTMESLQPKSLRLPALTASNTGPITTMATVNVRFDPSEKGAHPPRLSTLGTKLKASTFFASVPMNNIPSKATDFHYSSNKGIYVETVPLSSRCMASTQWERHASDAPPRRDSACSSLSGPAVPEPSSAYGGGSFYTAQMLVPVTLPAGNKVFVPTFHSCLISRVYALDLYLGIQSPSPTMTAPSMHLKVPIQISCEANPNAQPSISSQEAEAIAAREAHHILSHRSFTPSSPGRMEPPVQLRFALPSPEYSESELQATSGVPSPDYTEQVQSLRTALETAPPPGYSGFSPGDSGSLRTGMAVSMGTPWNR